jgi:hypothetical protein
MNPIRTVFKRELASYFATPVAYVFIVIFLVLAGTFTFYIGNFYERGQADLLPFFDFHPWLYLFLVPAVGMRLWSEERKSGTIELLMTLPITMWQAVVGKFLAAWDPKASTQNEQNIFTLATPGGEIEFKQIAGLIARRVISWKKPGESVLRGERVGLVRFGSRVDIWLPQDAQISVKVGNTVHGGSSVLARWAVQATHSASDVALAEASHSG